MDVPSYFIICVPLMCVLCVMGGSKTYDIGGRFTHTHTVLVNSPSVRKLILSLLPMRVQNEGGKKIHKYRTLLSHNDYVKH